LRWRWSRVCALVPCFRSCVQVIRFAKFSLRLQNALA
jgi:hypothetical protein